MIQLLDLVLFLGGNTFELLESGVDALQEHGLHPIAIFALVFGLQILVTEYAVEELGMCKHGTASILEGLSLIGFVFHSELSLPVKAAISAVILVYLLLKQKFQAAH